MQPNDAMRALIQQLSTTGFKIDMFSNGSFLYPEWLMSCPHLTIIMDWKLRGSGEAEKKVEEREQNVRKLRPHDCVKFVVTDRADLDEANNWTHYWTSHQMFRGIFYVGAAWGHIKDDELVEYIQEFRLPWRLNVQVHKHIWGELRGV